MDLKKKTIAAFVIMALVCSSVLQSSQAQAGMIFDMMIGNRGPYEDTDMGEVMFCLMVLPLCLLNEKAGEKVVFTKSDLIANGYSSEEADKLLKDQGQFFSSLWFKHERLAVTDKDTRASFEADIRSVDPNVSDEYVKLLTDSAAVK